MTEKRPDKCQAQIKTGYGDNYESDDVGDGEGVSQFIWVGLLLFVCI